jgi:hypothetical protein
VNPRIHENKAERRIPSKQNSSDLEVTQQIQGSILEPEGEVNPIVLIHFRHVLHLQASKMNRISSPAIAVLRRCQGGKRRPRKAAGITALWRAHWHGARAERGEIVDPVGSLSIIHFTQASNLTSTFSTEVRIRRRAGRFEQLHVEVSK